MRLTKSGILLIKRWEGVHDRDKRTKAIWEAQKDPLGIWTLGYGSIRNLAGKRVRRHDSCSPMEAELLLIRDTGVAANAVSRYLSVDLPDESFSALVSFTYNLGGHRFKSSTLRKKVNAQIWDNVPYQFGRWNKGKINGKLVPLRGLTDRRADEAKLFMKGINK